MLGHMGAPISKPKDINTPAIHLFLPIVNTELYTSVNFKFIYTKLIQLDIYKML